MPNLHPRKFLVSSAIRLAVASLILAMGLRTWLVMGLIDPVTIMGSSMVPTLQSGDRLWVDRTALLWRPPERWEVVVARNPVNAAELCIKRIVGLPGELVALRGGNVLVDGAVTVKSRDEQLALRTLVHCEAACDGRWQPNVETFWQCKESVWQHRSQPNGPLDWLRYQHPHSEPITDDVAHNEGLSRRLHWVDEFMLSTTIGVQGEGTLSLAIDDGTTAARIDLSLPQGEIALVVDELHTSAGQISARSCEQLVRGKVQLEFSNFDQQLLLVIDGRVELRRPWPQTPAAGTARPMAIGARSLDVWLADLRLYRDIYHSHQAVNTPPPLAAQWQLGSNEYFLLGDNSPISLDSRLWGPVSGRLLVGKPLP